MTRRVVITGAGIISPLADSPAGLHQALCEQRSARRPIELFPTVGLACRQAGEIIGFDPHLYPSQIGAGRNLRPLDRTSRLLVVAAGQALAAAGWTEELRRGEEVGLVLGTTFCSVRTIAEFDRRGLKLGPAHASPFEFANSVINAAAGQAAIWYGLRGVNSTVAGGEASGLLAIAHAAELIRSGRSKALLAGGVEELCFESFFGFYRAGRLCGSLAPRHDGGNGDGEFPIPFDARRNGFSLAEGAALLMLEEGEAAAERGARVWAEVLGHGSAFDCGRAPPPAAAPARAGAVARAIRLALDDAAIGPAQIGCLSASANGSVTGDRSEALGVAAALGGHAAELPVAAIKASLGEALGASGAFQAVELLSLFADGVVPGIAGFEEREPAFQLGGAQPRTRRLEGGGPGRALATAVGADGQCCAVVFGRSESAGSHPSAGSERAGSLPSAGSERAGGKGGAP
ncbi:MAG TPA: beta-ketoacyl synthase N-terminal-like domain-containing protein [Thermoanaerobaculia bacterium]|nr:beta-ketoacyl synthase N-terminal-like domain-containing protein [Thermoanaerobaculia bacterium]